MKITIKLPKPRNPVAVSAKVRKAGAHASDKLSRQRRRAEKRSLYLILSRRGNEDEGGYDCHE